MWQPLHSKDRNTLIPITHLQTPHAATVEEKGPGFAHSSGVENVPYVQAVVIVDTGHLKHARQKNTTDTVITGILLSPSCNSGVQAKRSLCWDLGQDSFHL